MFSPQVYITHTLIIDYSRNMLFITLVNNSYSYFREAWALAIYHDRFSDFRDEIRELLVNQPVGLLFNLSHNSSN